MKAINLSIIWARPKKESKKGVKIKIFGPVLRGFSPEIDPGTPLDRPGAPPDINLHQKSAPETNSKAISQWARGGYVLGRSHTCARSHNRDSHSDPGVLLKDPGVLFKGPGVLSEDPRVLLKDPEVL